MVWQIHLRSSFQSWFSTNYHYINSCPSFSLFLYFEMEVITIYPYSEMELSTLFPWLLQFPRSWNWFPLIWNGTKPFQMQENPRLWKSRKLCGNFFFIIRKSSTKFHFKVRKPHFKLWKSLFKRGLGRNSKIKNVSEFDIEKYG